MSRTTTEPSYVALGSDGSILEQGGDIYARQDPASTTKLWTLYTVLAMVRDGHLPRSFVNEHRHDLERMMIYSDNQASERIAVAADRATGGNGRVSNGELDAVPGFAEWMNRYANGDLASERISLDDTNFVTASGMPHQQHYSTAHDMALMMLRFRTDFEGSSVEEYRGMAGMSGSTVRAGNGTELSKTGTARGYHGSRGRYSFVGATDDGVYSVAGSATKGDRQTLNRRLARRTHDSDVSFDDIDLVNPETYLNARDAEREGREREELAARRRREAEQHNEFSDPDAIQTGIFGLIITFIMQIFGFEQNETRHTNTQSSDIEISNSDSAGINLSEALASQGILSQSRTEALRTDGVSHEELVEVTAALRARNISLADVDISEGNLDFDKNGVINASDINRLSQEISAITR